jgi:hypothetical protein
MGQYTTMPSASIIERDFKRAICESVQLQAEGIDRFRVLTPFLLDDGDHLVIVLKREDDRWVLTDEGHTFMHLTYDIDEKDLGRGTRASIITNVLAGFSVHDHDGELRLSVPDQQYGDALYNFSQALLKISDVRFLNRERVRSTFLEDFRELMASIAPTRHTFDWRDPKHDPEGKYPVDCRIEASNRPLFVYALLSDDKVRDTTISLLQFERWKTPYRSVGVFEDQESVNRKVLARFSDACEKQFSSLVGSRDRIETFILNAMTE